MKDSFNLKQFALFILFLSSMLPSIAQEDWTNNEKREYAILINLAHYVSGKEKSEISQDSLFEKYIYFDYVLNDTLKERKEKRLVAFDTLFYFFRKTVDSIGLNNLDAKPVRFYKDHEVYNPFDREKARESISGKKMYTRDTDVFAYYRKEDPQNPLGTLLFEPETGKLVAWIMINQGGYRYFLTFNLL